MATGGGTQPGADELELARALQRLPHGAGFRFLDQLTALEPGRSGAGRYRLREDEPFLKGHFPGQPLLPGVLMVEAAAQLAGVVAQSDPAIAPLPGLKLTAVRAAKIFGTISPGQTLEVESRIVGRMGNLVQAAVSARCEGKLLLQGELSLSGEPLA